MAAEKISAQSRICLKVIAPQTLDVVRELGTSNSEDVASVIIARLIGPNPPLSAHETIRRRIYDVINVLSAAGVIDKVGKQILWRGGRPAPVMPPIPSTPDASEGRVHRKEEMLREKVRLLTLDKVLIKRNFSRDQSPGSMTLPVILIGIQDPTHTTFTQSVNRCQLEIKSRRNMQFLAPSDILQKIDLPKPSIQGILTLSPDLSQYGTQLLKEPAKQEQ
jgi:hypothetical protein